MAASGTAWLATHVKEGTFYTLMMPHCAHIAKLCAAALNCSCGRSPGSSGLGSAGYSILCTPSALVFLPRAARRARSFLHTCVP